MLRISLPRTSLWQHLTLIDPQIDLRSRQSAEQSAWSRADPSVVAGVAPGLIRWHSGRHWRSLLPGVLMLNTGQPTDQQRLVAAQLYAGPAAWMRGDTALACLGSRSVV